MGIPWVTWPGLPAAFDEDSSWAKPSGIDAVKMDFLKLLGR